METLQDTCLFALAHELKINKYPRNNHSLEVVCVSTCQVPVQAESLDSHFLSAHGNKHTNAIRVKSREITTFLSILTSIAVR